MLHKHTHIHSPTKINKLKIINKTCKLKKVKKSFTYLIFAPSSDSQQQPTKEQII